MKLSDFHFDLPDVLIARYPAPERTGSRLLVLDGETGALEHRLFTDLLTYLRPDDLLVFNNTRVIPARLFGRKESGGRVEVMVERLLDTRRFKAHIRASKAPKPGSRIFLCRGEQAEDIAATLVVIDKVDGLYELELIQSAGTGTVGAGSVDVLAVMNDIGHMPLPPYIDRADTQVDRERYQTVYAARDGAVAAPTAGLHFSADYLQQCRAAGVDIGFVTLHVGAGTFLPVRVENVLEHTMHAEYIEVDAQLCEQVRVARARGGRVIAVGTTSVRALESAAASGTLQPFQGDTQIFIYPGYRFKNIDALVTNFHLPESTLLMLISALAGREQVLNAYREAVAQHYRFFSYGDAMLIFPQRSALA